MLNRLLIPLDGEPQAEAALECALAISRRNGSEVTLSAVVLPGDAVGSRQTARAYLADVRGRFELPTDIGATVRVGDPATEILAEARSFRADMILVPDRSTGGRSQGGLGRVTSRLLLGSPVPVLIVRDPLLAQSQEHNFVVMLDGSRLAEEAIQPAAELARLCKGRLTLATVLTRPSGQFGNLPSRWTNSSKDLDSAQRYLQKFINSPALEDLETSAQVFEDEISPFLDQIGHVARTVLVLTTRGASGFSRWVLGGVADRVSREATMTTMVIPPRMA